MNQALSIRQLLLLLIISSAFVIGVQLLDRQHQQNMSPYMSTPSQNEIFDLLFHH